VAVGASHPIEKYGEKKGKNDFINGECAKGKDPNPPVGPTNTRGRERKLVRTDSIFLLDERDYKKNLLGGK